MGGMEVVCTLKNISQVCDEIHFIAVTNRLVTVLYFISYHGETDYQSITDRLEMNADRPTLKYWSLN